MNKPKFCETCQQPLNKKCTCESNMSQRIEKVYELKGVRRPKKAPKK